MADTSAEPIGTVISGLESPSPSRVDFVVNKGILHRGMFVEIETEQGRMIGLVTDVIKTNRYFERADAVKEFEANGLRLPDQFPAFEWEFLVAQTRPLGVYQEGVLRRPSFPPSPGARVSIVAPAELSVFLGLDSAAGVTIGDVAYHDLPVSLDLSRFLKKHLAVLAQSGAGKTVAVKTIIEQVVSRSPAQGRPAVLVIDPHGEYSSLCFPPKAGEKAVDFSGKSRLVQGPHVRIAVHKIPVGMIATIVGGISPPQKRELQRVIRSLNARMRDGEGPYGFDEVKRAILADEDIKDNSKGPLLAWLESLNDLNLFSKTDSPSLLDLVRPGMVTVVDLSDLIDMKKKQIIVSYFADKLFHERRHKRIPPFLLVVEEAHQFAMERAKEEFAISKRVIETIAREGRKFGACLCLVSQRPVHLSTTALANCNTHLILRITNPYDLKHIGESSEGIDSGSERMITSLRVGEALLVGEAVNFPVFLKIRRNASPASKHEESLEESARQFENASKASAEEARQFL